jgi:CheY-like chemotaxis protein
MIKNAHVLVIDDNEDILFMLKAMLDMKGYRVTIKENTENIKTSIHSLLPDLILMDMLLSGADGREVCANLKADKSISHIPIIMISAHPQARQESIAAGADYFLSKPFEIMDLFQTIQRALV